MKRPSYNNLVPHRTFIDDYMRHMSGLETPHAYDFWCAVWLTSLALGRGLVVSRPRIPVHMNWYIMLCAESGLTRKSTAVKCATDVARVFLSEGAYHVDIIEDKTSPEGLEATLQKLTNEHGYAHCAISISELVRFLGKERYNTTMPGLLTDLYDSPSLRNSPGTLSRGPTTLRDVFVSFLSASTPSWLMKSINPAVVEGGFTSRVIFVHEERRKKPVPWPEEGDNTTVRRLVDVLKEIQCVAADVTDRFGGIALTRDALSVYKRWYNNRQEHRDTFRSTFEAREDEHVLRLAGVLAANDRSWEINSRHIGTATKIVLDAKERGASIFEGIHAVDSLARGIDRMREVLVAGMADPITQRDLYFKVRSKFDRETFNLTLRILHELRMVRKFQAQHGGKGKKTTLWQGTRLLTQQGALELILKEFDK